MALTYQIGELVQVKTVNKPGLYIILAIRRPLGWAMFDLLSLEDGTSRTCTILELEKCDLKFNFEEQLSEPSQVDESIPVPKRFKNTSESDVDELELAAKSKKTHSMTRWGVRIYKDWLVETGRSCDFESLPEAELAAQLKVFYAEVQQRNGEPYSIQSMRSIRAALYRHLTMPPHSRIVDILKGAAFSQANNVFIGSLKRMKQLGFDQSKHHSPISSSDIRQMYDSGVLSNRNPTSLLNKVFFEIMLHFGRRGREGLRSIRKDQIVFQRDEVGREYATLSFNSLEKNHQSLTSNETGHRQIMYGTATLQCPLTSLKLYISKLNERCDAFFQKARVVHWEQSPSWYCNNPIGVNTLAKMMSQISTAASLSQIYTNHSIRATCVTTLRDAGIPATDIMAVTGHRNVASIESYSQGPSAVVRATMSNKLAHTSSGAVDLMPVIRETVKLQSTRSMQGSSPSPVDFNQDDNEENAWSSPLLVNASRIESSPSNRAYIETPMEYNPLPLTAPSCIREQKAVTPTAQHPQVVTVPSASAALQQSANDTGSPISVFPITLSPASSPQQLSVSTKTNTDMTSNIFRNVVFNNSTIHIHVHK